MLRLFLFRVSIFPHGIFFLFKRSEQFFGHTLEFIYRHIREQSHKPGEYNEIVKITDASDNIAYDFAVVQIIDRNHPDLVPPAIHAACYPTFGIKPGDEVTFKVRSFRTKEGSEVWDLGDGTPKVTVQSDGNARVHNRQGYAVTRHRYKKAGHYIATVERSNQCSHRAVTHLHVNVGMGD